ncbi:hypothetical protein OV208_12355 [Corallococcus sp. bb12-1]|uniref:hypothetical protein n=1 Tax=Corallococcus sp. bb12-1 TaxID=2996784 RepID=UPI002270C14D|nr:hypothetical protein [Corallococcus sp. bb12-1]MCY1042108.1 hypothetical protein [Corallococcus sp. bb12-1]
MEPNADGIPDVVVEVLRGGQLNAKVLGCVEALLDALDERFRIEGALPVARVDAAAALYRGQGTPERADDASKLNEVVLVAALMCGAVDAWQFDDELEGLFVYAWT